MIVIQVFKNIKQHWSCW